MKFLLSLCAAALIGASGSAVTIVDASEVDRRRVALGETVTILGELAPELNRFEARSIEVARARS